MNSIDKLLNQVLIKDIVARKQNKSVLSCPDIPVSNANNFCARCWLKSSMGQTLRGVK